MDYQEIVRRLEDEIPVSEMYDNLFELITQVDYLLKIIEGMTIYGNDMMKDRKGFLEAYMKTAGISPNRLLQISHAIIDIKQRCGMDLVSDPEPIESDS